MNPTNRLPDFVVGQRVEINPDPESYLCQLVRYGDVVSIGYRYVTVKFDALDHPMRVAPDFLTIRVGIAPVSTESVG